MLKGKQMSLESFWENWLAQSYIGSGALFSIWTWDARDWDVYWTLSIEICALHAERSDASPWKTGLMLECAWVSFICWSAKALGSTLYVFGVGGCLSLHDPNSGNKLSSLLFLQVLELEAAENLFVVLTWCLYAGWGLTVAGHNCFWKGLVDQLMFILRVCQESSLRYACQGFGSLAETNVVCITCMVHLQNQECIKVAVKYKAVRCWRW